MRYTCVLRAAAVDQNGHGKKGGWHRQPGAGCGGYHNVVRIGDIPDLPGAEGIKLVPFSSRYLPGLIAGIVLNINRRRGSVSAELKVVEMGTRLMEDIIDHGYH